MYKKISQNIGILYRASKYLNFNCLKKLYFSLIHSHLNYGNIVWASCFKTKLKKLFVKQKHAIRIIFKTNRFASSKPLMLEMNALNIYQLNIFNILQFMYKIKHNMAPEIL